MRLAVERASFVPLLVARLKIPRRYLISGKSCSLNVFLLRRSICMPLVLRRYLWIRSLLLRRSFEWTRQTPLRSWSATTSFLILNSEQSIGLVQDELSSKEELLPVTTGVSLGGSRRTCIKEWHHHLQKYSQFNRESRLESIDARSIRLVDNPSYQTDIELWIELFSFRRRHGIEGALILWEGLKSRRTLERSSDSVKIWPLLLELGLAKPEILHEIFILARTVYEERGEKHSGWYRQVVGHFMKTKPVKSYYWHKRLMGIFPPSRTDILHLRAILLESSGNERARLHLEQIYKDLPFRDLYAEIIPYLCQADQYTTAIQWNYFLIENADLPPDLDCIQPLYWYLMATGQEEEAQCLKDMLYEHKDALSHIVSETPAVQMPISREMMDRIHGEFYSIAPKTFSDEFCARLFATSFFTVSTVIRGLHMFGMERIGPRSLREIALRAVNSGICNTEVIKGNLESLQEARISIGKSVLSRLIKKLTLRNNVKVLTDVVTSDLHPETFEDRELQESLLASYLQDQKQREIDYTLAILSVNTPDSLRLTTESNLLFRAYCKREDWNGALQMIKRMGERHIILTGTSCRYLLKTGVRERGVGKRFSADESLYRVIGICQEALVLGSYVPTFVWSELLTRLGIAGQLESFENLALWLATRYLLNATDNFRETYLTCRTLASTGDSNSASVTITDRHLRHDFEKIFSDAMVRGVIAWGFQHSVRERGSHNHPESKALVIQPFEELPGLWGLRMLLKLRKEYGVRVKDNIVAKACVTRLHISFGVGRSNRKINLQARQRHELYSYNIYLRAIERLWEKPIIQRYSKGLPKPPEMTDSQGLEQRILAGYSSNALHYQKRSRLQRNYRNRAAAGRKLTGAVFPQITTGTLERSD